MVERDATATLAESLGGCGGLLQQILHPLAWLGLRPRNRASAGTIRALSGPSEPRQLRQSRPRTPWLRAGEDDRLSHS